MQATGRAAAQACPGQVRRRAVRPRSTSHARPHAAPAGGPGSKRQAARQAAPGGAPQHAQHTANSPAQVGLTTLGTNSGCGAPSAAAASNTRPVPSPTTASRTGGRPAARQPSRNTEAASGEVMHTQSKWAACSASTCVCRCGWGGESVCVGGGGVGRGGGTRDGQAARQCPRAGMLGRGRGAARQRSGCLRRGSHTPGRPPRRGHCSTPAAAAPWAGGRDQDPPLSPAWAAQSRRCHAPPAPCAACHFCPAPASAPPARRPRRRLPQPARRCRM